MRGEMFMFSHVPEHGLRTRLRRDAFYLGHAETCFRDSDAVPGMRTLAADGLRRALADRRNLESRYGAKYRKRVARENSSRGSEVLFGGLLLTLGLGLLSFYMG